MPGRVGAAGAIGATGAAAVGAARPVEPRTAEDADGVPVGGSEDVDDRVEVDGAGYRGATSGRNRAASPSAWRRARASMPSPPRRRRPS